MEDEAQVPAAKPVVTIARYQDRIPTDKSAEEAASIHGAGSIYVNGKCYADILREQGEGEVQPVVAATADVAVERRHPESDDLTQEQREEAARIIAERAEDKKGGDNA